VLVADGTFAQSITINKNHVHLKGSGLEKTFLQPDPTNQNVAITLDGVNDVKITGFTISDSHDYGIESTNSTFVVEQNLFVENSTAIKLTASRSSIKDNMFDGGYRGEGSISIKSSQAVISENIFEGEATVINDFMGGYGPSIVTIADNNFTDVDPAIDNAANCASCVTRIVRNIITANVLIDRGISNSGPAVISENTIEKCALSAIHNSSDEAVIANNLLRNCGTNNGAINGCAISNFGTSTITGNSILNNPGHGVQIIRGIATVNGNMIKDNGGYGVSSVGKASIMGNTFINNGLGCINQNVGIVAAANLCESSFSVLGTITAEEDLNVHANKDMSITAGKNMIISAGENIPITSGKNIPVVAGENMLINAGKDISVVAGENINSEAAVSTAIGSSKDTTIQSGGDTLIESKDITLQASDDITIESLEGTIRLKGTVIP
jgi:hypothetical protein